MRSNSQGVIPKKALGQNFLVDEGVLKQIVDAITLAGLKTLIEVGPGTGVLTSPLLDYADHLTSIEFDRDLVPFLEQSFADRSNFTLVHADILDWQPGASGKWQVASGKNGYQTPEETDPTRTSYPLSLTTTPYHLVGNIPYNLTTKLFEKILMWKERPAAITFLMQREVAEKISRKGGKNSPLVLAAECLGEAKLLFHVPPTAFNPPPKVVSSVLQIDGSKRKTVDDPWKLYDFAHKIFRNPRKTLLNNLLALMDKEKAVVLMAANGLDPMVRPERLSFQEILGLFHDFSGRENGIIQGTSQYGKLENGK